MTHYLRALVCIMCLGFAPAAKAIKLSHESFEPALKVWSLHAHRIDLSEFHEQWRSADQILILEREPSHATRWRLREVWRRSPCELALSACPHPDPNDVDRLMPQAGYTASAPTPLGDTATVMLFVDNHGAARWNLDIDQFSALRIMILAQGGIIQQYNDGAWGMTTPAAERSAANTRWQQMRAFDRAVLTRRKSQLKRVLRDQPSGVQFASRRHAFCDMAERGWSSGMRMMIAHDASLTDTTCAFGLTPLAGAIRFARKDAIVTLLEHGAATLGAIQDVYLVGDLALANCRWTLSQFLKLAEQAHGRSVDLSKLAAARDLLRIVAAQDPNYADQVRLTQPALWAATFPDTLPR